MNPKFVIAKTLMTEDAQIVDSGQYKNLRADIKPNASPYVVNRILGGSERRSLGLGGKMIYVYNYTDKTIGFYDSSNNLTLVSPISPLTSVLPSQSDCDMNVGSVIVEVIYFHGGSDGSIIDNNERIINRVNAFEGINQDITRQIPSYTYNGGVHAMAYSEELLDEIRVRHQFTDFHNTVKKYGTAIYSEELDLVLDPLIPGTDIVIHPRSTEALMACVNEKPVAKDECRVKVEFKINDSEYQMERAFVNLTGGVVEVPITRHKHVKNGITICTGNSTKPGERDKFYKFGEECPFKFFTSRELASTFGDTSKLVELENLKRKEEAAQKAHDLAMEKIKNDMAKVEADKQAFALKLEQEAAKAAQEAAKLEAEKLAFERKVEQSEYDYRRQLESRDREIKDMVEKEAREAKRHRKEMEASRQRMVEAEAAAAREKDRAERAEKLKEENLARTEALENASFFRKNVSEVLKIAGTIVSAAAAFATIYIKFFK